MKVLHINRNYTCTTLHQTMVEKLDAMGHENLVFAPTDDGKLIRVALNDNVVVSECFRKWDRLVFDYKQHKIQKSVEEKVNVSEYNCIHAYTLFTDGNCARNLSQKYHIPYVVAVRNTDVNGFFRRMPHLRGRGLRIMRDASAVLFLSETYRQQVFSKYVPKKYHAQLREKTFIIPNGIDNYYHENTSPAEPKKAPDKQNLKLVFAGRLDKNKNVPTIQKAMDLLEQKGYSASLTVVGRVEDKKSLALLQADSRVTYLPPVGKEELLKIYRQNDIFVMPSYTESFGLVYAEAISQGLPVVYSQGQGFDNQFPEGEVGYRVDAHSAESIAEAIIRIVAEYPVITKDLSSKADRYHWDEICQQYDRLYKQICTG